jgi:hypothetical protein
LLSRAYFFIGSIFYTLRILDTVLFSQDDANVILVNWQKAARGQYSRAASNAELVGRQVGKTLIAMVTMGTNPSDIHVIGFSLGAQVAGFIGETLKSYGLKLGRITGEFSSVFIMCLIH